MQLASIDRSAVAGTSWLHRAAPPAKLLAFAFVLAAAVTSTNALVLVGALAALAAAVVSAGVDRRLAFGLAAYPALFAAVFAFASAPDPLAGATIVLKAACAGTAAVTLVLTTPYPQLFAPVQRVVPGIAGDALLMTYRATFLLLDRFGELLRAVRLRSGVRRAGVVRTARAATRALGGLVLYALDLSEREYDVLRLRGYTGRLRAAPLPAHAPAADALALAGAATLALTSALWRFAPALLPWSWVPPLAAVVLLGVTLVLTRRSR